MRWRMALPALVDLNLWDLRKSRRSERVPGNYDAWRRNGRFYKCSSAYSRGSYWNATMTSLLVVPRGWQWRCFRYCCWTQLARSGRVRGCSHRRSDMKRTDGGPSWPDQGARPQTLTINYMISMSSFRILLFRISCWDKKKVSIFISSRPIGNMRSVTVAVAAKTTVNAAAVTRDRIILVCTYRQWWRLKKIENDRSQIGHDRTSSSGCHRAGPGGCVSSELIVGQAWV